MKTLIIMFAIFVTAGQAWAHGHPPPPPPAPTVVQETNVTENNYQVLPVGVAIAGASGSCVKDWKPGWQKCLAWAMVDVDVDGDDDTVHAFGGGITTRVDQFAIHVFGGFENFGTDQEAILFTGSINWR